MNGSVNNTFYHHREDEHDDEAEQNASSSSTYPTSFVHQAAAVPSSHRAQQEQQNGQRHYSRSASHVNQDGDEEGYSHASLNDDDDDERDLPDLDDMDLSGMQQRKYQSLTCCERTWDLLRRCHPWKIIPSIMVSNAVSFAVTTLCICNLVHRREQTRIADDDTDAYASFGLWSFRENENDSSSSSSSFFQSPLEECIYFDDIQHPAHFDPFFRTARAMGILACSIGLLVAGLLWLGVLRDYEATTHWRQYIGIALVLCCILEGMTLMVLQSETCTNPTGEADTVQNNNNDKGSTHECTLGRGGEAVIVSCILFLGTGILMMKWPKSTGAHARQLQHSTLAEEEEGVLGTDGEGDGLVKGDESKKHLYRPPSWWFRWFGGRPNARRRRTSSTHSHSIKEQMEMAPLTEHQRHGGHDETDGMSFHDMMMESFHDEASMTLDSVALQSNGDVLPHHVRNSKAAAAAAARNNRRKSSTSAAIKTATEHDDALSVTSFTNSLMDSFRKEEVLEPAPEGVGYAASAAGIPGAPSFQRMGRRGSLAITLPRMNYNQATAKAAAAATAQKNPTTTTTASRESSNKALPQVESERHPSSSSSLRDIVNHFRQQTSYTTGMTPLDDEVSVLSMGSSTTPTNNSSSILTNPTASLPPGTSTTSSGIHKSPPRPPPSHETVILAASQPDKTMAEMRRASTIQPRKRRLTPEEELQEVLDNAFR